MLGGNLSLEGRFKFDVYRSGKKQESIYKKNFITSTGLSYPSVFAFADCFRFISLGSGTTPNTIQTSVNNGWGTTGLSNPINQFLYIGSRTDYNDPNTSQYESQACGYREQTNQITLTRGWRIPTGTDLFNTNYTFNEFMVSPGRPYITGVNGTTACSCFDFVFDTGGNQLFGLDCSEVANYYQNPQICSGNSAFARVVQEIDVAQGDFLVVSYDLNITFNTGTKLFNLNINNFLPNGTRTTNWSGFISGYSDQIHHGLKLINDGTILDSVGPEGISRAQIDQAYTFGLEYGESFIPPWGAPIEPSCPIINLTAYLTTDNLQFLLNSISGGAFNNIGSSGIMSWHSSPTQEVKNLFSPRYYNVRQKSSNPYYPSDTGFNQDVTADSMSFVVDYIPGSRWSRTPMSAATIQSRSRTGSYSWQFWGRNSVESGFASQPVRAMTLGYIDTNISDVVPFYDLIFSQIGGSILPPINFGGQTYTLPNNNYFFMQDGADLTLSFNMAWSSPCDPSVSGC